MKIGELSKEASVKVGTIRFYERRKLLKVPLRTPSGYRSYAPQDVKVVRGIKQLQELGFTLREIKELIDLHRTSSACVSTGSTEPRGVLRMIALTKEKLLVIERTSKFRTKKAYSKRKWRLREGWAFSCDGLRPARWPFLVWEFSRSPGLPYGNARAKSVRAAHWELREPTFSSK